MKQQSLYILALLFATLQTFAQTYTYDNLNRLTKVAYGNGVTITYGYDGLGNRTSKKVTGGTTVTTFTITTNVTPSGSGMVTGGGSFAKGATVELHAISNAGYEFSKWSDGETDNPRTVIVENDMSYTAQFKESSTVTPDLLGDIVVDGKVDWQDLDALAFACVSNAPATKYTDINGDGSLSVLDITQLISIISANSDNSVKSNGHQYVDLGLPSGTLWATCNVGALTPEQFGNYYAWAETSPKDIYNWETYEWCNGTVCNNSNNTLTKYCLEGGWGSMDGKSVIEPGDDVAQTNWGGDWRIPTEAEVLELINNCESKWETVNGVKGRTFTGVNGKSIFLPAAGSKEKAEYYSGDGQYWTSSLSTTGGHSSNAKHMEFTRSSIELFEEALYGAIRYYGLTVRPVITKSTQGVPVISVTPTTIDFGRVELGTDKTKTFTVKNTGEGNLTFKIICKSSCFDVTDNEQEFTIGAGKSKTYSVTGHGQPNFCSAGATIRVISDAEDGNVYVDASLTGYDNIPANLTSSSIEVSSDEIKRVQINNGSGSYEVISGDTSIAEAYVSSSGTGGGGRYETYNKTANYVSVKGKESGITVITIKDRERGDVLTLQVHVVG